MEISLPKLVVSAISDTSLSHKPVEFGARVSLSVQSLTACPTGEFGDANFASLSGYAQDVYQPFGLTALDDQALPRHGACCKV